MLTSELGIVGFDGEKAVPDRLLTQTHGHYLAYAERMLSVYRSGAGRTRRDLHRAVEAAFADEPDCDLRRVRAFCKLLDDASVYDTDRGGSAAVLRLRVFRLAAQYHPLVESPDLLFDRTEAAVKADIARELGKPWGEIDAELYADVIDLQPLKEFPGYRDGEALLSRYNVAQVQAALYRAVRMQIEATADFKQVIRYVKLAHLLHTIRRLGPSRYGIELTGQTSILRETRRYGVALARLLPALLSCRGWSLAAAIRRPWGGTARLDVSSQDGLKGEVPAPAEFDSTVEAGFAEKFGAERDGWTLHREAEILCEDQTVFVPDFLLRHADGTEVLFEIVGFWTPEYLKKKRETLRLFKARRILLAVAEQVASEKAKPTEDVILYKTSILLDPVLAALERIRATGARPSRG